MTQETDSTYIDTPSPETEIIVPPAGAATSRLLFRGRPVLAVKILWAALVFATLGLFIIAVPLRFQQLSVIASAGAFASALG